MDKELEFIEGKNFNKKELIDRLILIGANLDNKDYNKKYYSEMYDTLMESKKNRDKIKSLLETDKKSTNLNKKRKRDETSNNVRFNEDNKFDNYNNDNKEYENFQNNNLNLKNFMEKIDTNLDEYKNKLKTHLESSSIKQENKNDEFNLNEDSYIVNSSDDTENYIIKNIEKPINKTQKLILNKNQINSELNKELKTITGSTKNIKEVIKRLNSKKSLINLSENNKSETNTPNISSKNLIKINTSNHTQLSILNNKKLTNSIIEKSLSLRNPIIVDVRNVETTEFKQDEEQIINNENIKSIFNLKHYKYSLVSLSLVALTGAGIYFLLENFCQNRDLTCLERFNDFINTKPEITLKPVLIILAILIVVYLIKKYLDNKKYEEITLKDYSFIKDLLKSNYDSEESPLGLFEVTLIKDLAKKNKMSEVEYKNNIFTKLVKLRVKKNEIIENVLIIQEQKQNVWNLKENSLTNENS